MRYKLQVLRNSKWLLTLGYLLFWAGSVLATLPVNQQNAFDVEKANKQFDEISIKLSTQELNLKSLSTSVSQLQSLKEKAKACVDEAQANISSIEEKLKKPIVTEKEKPTPEVKQEKPNILREDIKFLQEKREKYLNQASQCRLFVLRSDEAIKAYQATIDKLTATQLLQRSVPIWHLFNPKTYEDTQEYTWHKILRPTGLADLHWVALAILSILVVSALIIGIFLHKKLKEIIKGIDKNKTYLRTILLTFRYYLVPFFVLLTIIWYMFFVFLEVTYAPTLVQTVYLFLIYYLALAIVKMIFFPPKPAKPLVIFPNSSGKKLYRCTKYFLRYLLLGALIILIFDLSILSVKLFEILRATFVSILIVFLACWFWRFVKATVTPKSLLQYILKGTIATIGALLVSIEFAGYHQLCIFVIARLLVSIATIGLFVLSHKCILFLIHGMEEIKISKHNLKYYLGLTAKEKIKEGVVIFFVSYTIVICYLLIVLMDFWGVPKTFTASLTNSLIEGFTLAGLTVKPLNIAYALVAFALVTLLGRLFSTHVVHITPYKKERTAQVTFASVISYVSFSIAFIVALVVLGIDFTMLAIIAGALSIGIGLGLQGIVNNFVSGLILLIEKPVRPGDRVVVNDTEGFIKKIGFRSTQVTTLSRSDMIIPNSDMITAPVINYMLQDKLWRANCSVGVAYGSDVKKTMDVLFDVASNNPNVVQEAPNQPQVLFKEHGDSSLIFELWCIIKDVDKKFRVKTELNAAINAAFKKHGIEIAFPQQDIHIKDLPTNHVASLTDDS